MKRFCVKRDAKARIIKDGLHRGDKAIIEDYVTKKISVFSEDEVIVDPIGKLGLHGPLSPTVGGDFAREGYYGFQKAAHTAILIIHRNQVELS
jgi:hypothetical protein